MDVCNKHPTVIGVFADWCPHCVKFKPTFLGFKHEGVHFVAVKEGTPHGNRAIKQLGVRSFPSIYVCKNGQFKHYTGPRTQDAIVAFAQGP